MICNLAQGDAGLRQWKITDQLANSVRHILGGEKGIAQISHRHDHIVGKPWYICMVFRIKRNDNTNGNKDLSEAAGPEE